MQEYGIYVGVGSLFTLVSTIIGIMWKFARLQKENRDWTEALVDNLRRDLTDLERGSLGRAEILTRETGELGHALRTKIHEAETWNRDTFVRKDSFETVITRIEKTFEKGIDKLEDKIEKAMTRFSTGHS